MIVRVRVISLMEYIKIIDVTPGQEVVITQNTNSFGSIGQETIEPY